MNASTALRAADWRDRAACRGVDPDLFFPVTTEGPALEQAARAQAVCDLCPVTRDCLEFALRQRERDGIWGGLSPEDRGRLLDARTAGVSRCAHGWHPLTGDNVLPGGVCRACSDSTRRARETRRLTRGAA